MITTIIFDLSEVYLHGLLGIEKHLEEAHGITIESKVWQTRKLEKLFHGEITEDAFWQEMIRTQQLNLTVDDLKQAIRENFQEIKGTRDIIEALKKQGYKLGLLSVHAKEWIKYCEKNFNYHKLFDSRVYSFEVAVCKPEKRAYEIIMEKLRVKPNECIFIDDTERNLQAAKEIGMKEIKFQSAEKLRIDLVALGIHL